MRQVSQVTRLYLWRHPEVRGFEAGKFFGHTDVAMTRKGQLQAKAMAKYMSAFRLSNIYCSDLDRSRLTADVIARHQGRRLKPKSQRELRELNLGIWEGLSFADIATRYPKELEDRFADLTNYRVPKGESLSDLALRAVPVVDDLVAANEGLEICLVGHGGLNRVILADLLGMPLDRIFRLEQTYGCLNIIDVFEDGVPVVQLLNQPLDME